MERLIEQVKNFVLRKVIPSVEYYEKNKIYPLELVEILKSMGAFGLTIPRLYHGLECDMSTRLQIISEVSNGWVSLSIILESHFNVCDSILQFGSDEQKGKYLPLLAKGKLVATNQYPEENSAIVDSSGTYLLNFDNSLDKWVLTGQNNSRTYSINADIFGIFAPLPTVDKNFKSINSCFLLVEKANVGMGVFHDSNSVAFKDRIFGRILFENCLIETNNIIGEFNYDGQIIMDSLTRNFSITALAHAIGISKRIINYLLLHIYIIGTNFDRDLESSKKESQMHSSIPQLTMKFQAAQSLFNDFCLHITTNNKSQFLPCLVLVRAITEDIHSLFTQLFPSSNSTCKYSIANHLRESLSFLALGHRLADISLTGLGRMEIEHFKMKQQNPTSVILKYAPFVLPDIKYEFLLEATLEENEMIVDTGYYSNSHIKLFLYDMTTFNPSGTFKDFLNCVTIAHCLQNRINLICAQSSGNTAMSLMRYVRKHPSIRIIQFYITRNSYKINSIYLPDNIILIEINSTEAEMRRIVKRFSTLTGIPIFPNLPVQINANKIRAYFVEDYCKTNKTTFDWYVQSISSAFGPIGLYQGFQEINNPHLTPKFLGVQQEAVCPFARSLGFWNKSNDPDKQIELIEPTLFCSNPGELIDRVKRILDTYGGRIKVLTRECFDQYLNEALSIFSKNGIHLTRRTDGSILERAGILALIAALHEINDDVRGVFLERQKILIGITGGTGCPAIEKPKPKLILNENPTDEQLKCILEHVPTIGT